MVRIYIGRIDGASTLALTGVGVCFLIITMLSAFAGLMGSGGGPLMSMARGRKDEEEAGRIMGTSFFLLVVTAVILPYAGGLGVNGVFLAEPISNLVGAAPVI